MNIAFRPRLAAALAALALAAGCATGLTGCRMGDPRPSPSPASIPLPQAGARSADAGGSPLLGDRVRGIPPDRVDDLRRARTRARQLPAACDHSVVVEHRGGGFHVTCLATAP